MAQVWRTPCAVFSYLSDKILNGILRGEFRLLIKHNHSFPDFIRSHLVISFAQTAKTFYGDQAISAFGLVGDESNTLSKIFLVQFRVIQFLVVGVKQVETVPFDSG